MGILTLMSRPLRLLHTDCISVDKPDILKITLAAVWKIDCKGKSRNWEARGASEDAVN